MALLMLRELFRLPHRQIEGLGHALVAMLGVDIKIPDYSSLAKRAKKLNIEIEVAIAGRNVVDVVVDSTGLKAFGEGEWRVRQHGASGTRMCRKLHLAVEPDSHQVVAEVMTGSGCHDGDKAFVLVDQAKTSINKLMAAARMTNGRFMKDS